MATEKKISTLVSKQVPNFVLEDHPNFVAFLEAYYEYLEQNDATYDTTANLSLGKAVSRSRKMLTYRDVDQTLDAFSQKLYSEFLALLPKDTRADKDLILKNIKDFYRSRGSEKSVNFLFRVLFGESVEMYYPKRDILIASSGKWKIERSIRVKDTTINGQSDESLLSLQSFENTQIVGEDSNATAFVEKILISYENNTKIIEMFFSNREGDFTDGENITATNKDGDVLDAMIFSGQVVSITLTNAGTRYNIGDSIIFESSNGSGAAAFISNVTTGIVENVSVIYGGAGFTTNDIIQFVGGGGMGANAVIGLLDGSANSYWHPNTYNLNSDIIQNYANITLNTANYGFPNFANVNANTTLANSLSMFVFGPTGPLSESGGVILIDGGDNYVSVPTVDIYGNTRIKSLGVLGRMRINDAGLGYAVGDQINFHNGPTSYGFGANANVASVNGAGSITRVQFTPNTGVLTGGMGYSIFDLPTTSITSANGTGANISVTTLLGYGIPQTQFEIETGNIGSILAITLTSQGQGYRTAPSINLTTQGDGTAQAYSNIVSGSYTYPGRYLDDTGFLSSYNFLQDRDYYQNYSYVIKVRKSLTEWMKYVKDIVHPAGMKLFGEYLIYDVQDLVSISNAITANISSKTFYTTNAISYGAGGFLQKNTAITGMTNSKSGSISLWFKPNTIPSGGNNHTIFSIGDNNAFLLAIANSSSLSNESRNYIAIVGKNDGNVMMELRTNTSNPISPNNWYHVIGSWNLTDNTKRHLYLTDIASLNVITFTNDNLTWNVSNSSIASKYNASDKFDGCLAQIWFDDEYVDISNANIRHLFISTILQPVDLGPTGNTPTGNTPLVYLNGDASTITINLGAGGNFSLNGSISNCNTNPNIV